jgi:hypothetical protein
MLQSSIPENNVQGTNNGVSTDFDGKFQLSNVKEMRFYFLSLDIKKSLTMLRKNR